MASHYEAPIRKPLVTGDKSYHDVTLDVVAAVEGKANKSWWIVFSIALAAFSWALGHQSRHNLSQFLECAESSTQSVGVECGLSLPCEAP